MNTLEIVLLVMGGIIFILSFIVPARKEEMLDETKELVKDEVKGLVEAQMSGVKEKISDIVDETITYTVEKTERSLERISNEKIMAVNEYSDTVLGEINKNHKEVLFLYDMLNNKHQNIKDTVSEVEKTVKEATQTAKEVAKEVSKEAVKAVDVTPKQEPNFEGLVIKEIPAEASIKGKPKTVKKVENTENIVAPDISFTQGSREKGLNNNTRILELHNAGKSNVAIAKELGLGIGEVKLVIDLFEGM